MPPTASPLEVGWTLFAFFGLIGALGVAVEAAADWRDQRARPDKATPRYRRDALVAQTVFRNRVVAAFVQAVFVILGLRAMSLPPNPASGDVGTQATGLLFLLASLLMSGTALLDYRDRVRYRHIGNALPRPATVPPWRARRAARFAEPEHPTTHLPPINKEP